MLYGLGVSLTDFFYRQQLLKSVEFNLPVISVGNLSVGGAGKTPHVEYLIRLLKDYIHLGTLSRGYKRKTRGYLEIQTGMTAEQGGDEPLQYKSKFPDIVVTVSESRSFAIPQIVGNHPQTQVIILDDAFQHRAVKPGLNILLTEYDMPFTRDYLLPAGRLREWRSAYTRADVIVVSKCPPQLSEAQRQAMIAEIQPQPHQKIFFSYYEYEAPYYLLNSNYTTQLQPDWDVLLISAIANTRYLSQHLLREVATVHKLEYEDHHFFTNLDMGNLLRTFELMESDKKLIVTTEKDAVRLEMHRPFLQAHRLPVFVLPVRVAFHFGEGELFDQYVRDYLLNFKA